MLYFVLSYLENICEDLLFLISQCAELKIWVDKQPQDTNTTIAIRERTIIFFIYKHVFLKNKYFKISIIVRKYICNYIIIYFY